MAEQQILLVDMDPQGNLTSGVGLKGQSTQAGTIYQALTSPDPIEDSTAFILQTRVKDMWLIPADRNLTGAKSSSSTCPTRSAFARSACAAAVIASTSSSSTRRRRSGCSR